jgi:type VI secretion system protein ImpM
MLTGFHGKLPCAGDFLTRGLPTGFAAFWDGWAALNLAHRHEGWPEGGLRLRLVSGGRVAAGVVIPGADRVGRRFPLAAFVISQALPAAAGLDPWCDAAFGALRAAQGAGLDPDALEDRLQALAPPQGNGPDNPMLVWTKGRAAAPCDPAAPGAALAPLFSCS